MSLIRFILFCFSFLAFISFGMERGEFLETVDTASCLSKDCINTDIVNDVENISDLYNVIDEFAAKTISEQKAHVYYYEYFSLKEDKPDNTFDLLYYEYTILHSLGFCLNPKAANHYEVEEWLDEEFLSRYGDFFYGDLKESASMELGSYYYQCLIEKGEDYLNSALKFDEHCKSVAYSKYFNEGLDSKLREFKDLYGGKTLNELKAEFKQCHNNTLGQYKQCYRKLNNELLVLKEKYFLETLVSESDVKLSKRKQKKYLKEMRECLDNSANLAQSCKLDLLRVILKDKIPKQFKNLDMNIFDDIVVKGCWEEHGLKAEKICLDDVLLTLKGGEHVESKIYQNHLTLMNSNWKSIPFRFHEISHLETKNERFNDETLELLEKNPELSLTEAQCVYDYTKKFVYAKYNEQLWFWASGYGGARPMNSYMAARVGCLNSALHKMGENQQNDAYQELLFRGIGRQPLSMTKRFKIKEACITFTGTTSTSLDITVAKQFKKPDGFLLKIHNCPVGDQNAAVDISLMSEFRGEAEYLFPGGVNFRVITPIKGEEFEFGGEVELECVPASEVKNLDCY